MNDEKWIKLSAISEIVSSVAVVTTLELDPEFVAYVDALLAETE